VSGFPRYWTAAAISAIGTAITAVAMPVLVVQVLDATPVEVGIVNAAQFIPYALLGLVAGVYVDRWRRKPVLVWASVGRGVSLALIPLLWMLGALHLWVLFVLLLTFGCFAVFGFAATQSLLPQVLPRSRLLAANARLDQAEATAQTAGPAVGGALVSLLGAPLTIVVDALSYLVDAVLIGSIRIEEAAPRPRADRHLGREIREGLRWMYRHPTLRPLAVSAHVWFLANGAGLTVLAVFALRTLALSPVVYGILFAVSGVATLLGALIAPVLGNRLGAGRTIIAGRILYPVAWILVALAPAGGGVIAIALLAAGLALHGLAGGIENANEMGYGQAVTPDRLLGRVNGVRRAANRTAGALGAIAGGVAVSLIGPRPAVLAVVVVFAIAAMIAVLSPLRGARHDAAEV
jgi:MFS family permease